MNAIATEARNANLTDMIEVLRQQQAAKLDVVVSSTAIRARGGQIVVKGAGAAEITMDGVTPADGVYRPTEVFDTGMAAKLNIPAGYLGRMRTERPDLYDANVNGWLHGRSRRLASGETEVVYPADERKFLLRLFTDGQGGGVARAMLSDRYGIMEHIDGAMAMLAGIRETGAQVEITSCDLTDKTMRIRVAAPDVRAMAPTLLAGYRSPFMHGAARANDAMGLDHLTLGLGGQDPVVFAGFELRNSEVGHGKYSIVPVITALICTNGMTFTKQAMERRHVGVAMDEGIQWSQDTTRKHGELVAAMTRDAVSTFLSQDWLTRNIAEIEGQAGRPVSDPAETVKRLSNDLKFDAATQAGILEHFITGGQLTSGGVVNAITSYAQTVSDGDKAQGIEDKALTALALLAR